MPFTYGLLAITLIVALSPSPLTAQEPKPRPPGVTRLPPPKGITARQVGDSKIQVSWGSVPDAVKYQITRSVPPTPQTVLPPVADTVYLDQDVQPGSTYYYVVQAIDASGAAGLKAGSASPVTAVAGGSGGAAPVALRKIQPVTSLTAYPFPRPYVVLSWSSTQGGVSYIVERSVQPDDPKGTLSWQTRTKTEPLPCCHWSVLDDGRDLPQGARVRYRVTAVDTASPSNRSTPAVSLAVAPWTTHSYNGKAGEFWLRPQTIRTLTLRVGGDANISAWVVTPGGGFASMDESIATTTPNGRVVAKGVGVTYVVALNKVPDGSPRITPYRVLVLP